MKDADWNDLVRLKAICSDGETDPSPTCVERRFLPR